jgi:hypothetical protein
MSADERTLRAQEHQRDTMPDDEYMAALKRALGDEPGVYEAKQARLNAIGLSIAMPRTFRASRGSAR